MKDHVKIFFHLEVDDDGWPPVAVESMWARERDIGYEIANVPFYALGVACGDLIAVRKDDDGSLWFDHIIRASGHSTIHILLMNQDDVPTTRKDLVDMGCAVEGNTPRMLAVDIPPSVDYKLVREYLEHGELQDVFAYQEACLGGTNT